MGESIKIDNPILENLIKHGRLEDGNKLILVESCGIVLALFNDRELVTWVRGSNGGFVYGNYFALKDYDNALRNFSKRVEEYAKG